MVDVNWRHGELSVYERKLLYSFVKRFKPSIVFEAGTGLGGSSYFILNALKDSDGVLYTCDPRRHPDTSLYREFRRSLRFYRQPSHKLIDWMLRKKIIPDFIFFDGPDDPNVALNDFILLDKFTKKGTIFSMHDWGVQAKKASKLRPYLKSLPTWKILCEPKVNEVAGDGYTVGIVFAEKI